MFKLKKLWLLEDSLTLPNRVTMVALKNQANYKGNLLFATILVEQRSSQLALCVFVELRSHVARTFCRKLARTRTKLLEQVF